MKKFDEVLKARREEVRQQRSRALTMQRKRMKKERRIENIINGIMLTLVIGLGILLIMIYHNISKNDISNCVNAGHTKEYCESGF